jgi:lipopolysaccharide transport system ATP-binding protein
VFSIVTSVPAEIVLMDEWLSVGDAAFMQQAQQRLHALVEQASILVLASHSEEIIADMCNVVVRMEHGEVKSVERRG